MRQWLSFADPQRPTGTQFLGVAIVEAPDILTATLITHAMGINPGGEVLCLEVPEHHVIPDEFMNRLLSRADAEKLYDDLTTVAEFEAEHGVSIDGRCVLEE